MIHATALFMTSLLPPRNAGGNVEYIATFTLYAQIHPSPEATLIDAVANHGGDQLPREYASGDFYLLSGWQGEIRFGVRVGATRLKLSRSPLFATRMAARSLVLPSRASSIFLQARKRSALPAL
jgi:hypothetical protein